MIYISYWCRTYIFEYNYSSFKQQHYKNTYWKTSKVAWMIVVFGVGQGSEFTSGRAFVDKVDENHKYYNYIRTCKITNKQTNIILTPSNNKRSL